MKGNKWLAFGMAGCMLVSIGVFAARGGTPAEGTVINEAGVTEETVGGFAEEFVNVAVADFAYAPNGQYTRVNKDGALDEEGEYLYFGNYPQKKVTDSGLQQALTEEAGALPQNGDDKGWTAYKYYIERKNTSSFMWYRDISYGGSSYRGVYFKSYRPHWTDYKSKTDNTYQDNNKYNTNKVYWFLYEPLMWRILSEGEENGEQYATILCEMLIDSQEYSYTHNNRIPTPNTRIYPNNYAESSVRKFLNNAFYKTAFGDGEKSVIQKVKVNNGAGTTNGDGVNRYACEDTEDNVWLLSQEDITNEAYGFKAEQYDEDEMRLKKTTDYAQCQGAFTATEDYKGYGIWWLRSPYEDDGVFAKFVTYYGHVNYGGADDTSRGVCPALKIKLS